MKEKQEETLKIQEAADREEYLKKNLGLTQAEIRRGREGKTAVRVGKKRKSLRTLTKRTTRDKQNMPKVIEENVRDRMK